MKSRAGPTFLHQKKKVRRKKSEAVSRETACQVLLSLVSEEVMENEQEHETGKVVTGTVETRTMTVTLGKDTDNDRSINERYPVLACA